MMSGKKFGIVGLFVVKTDVMRSLLMLLTAIALAGCSASAPEPVPAAADHSEAAHEEHGEEHGHHHHHDAPHGGTLLEIGDHVAHLEIVLDAEGGALTVYVLDGEAENPVRLADAHLAIEIQTADGAAMELSLAAVANALTGETAGDSSQFQVRDARLAGVTEFDGTIPAINVRGVAATAVAFHHPGGDGDAE